MKREETTKRIESRLARLDSAIDVLLVEIVGGREGTIRLFIDHPDGVDHALCSRVTDELREWLDEFGLEVSSPGLERPLRKPHHYRRFIGSRARVRTTEPVGGRRRFTGVLVRADDDVVTLDTGDGEVSIPLTVVRRSNLVAHE